MKILLFGKGGQVGWELQRSLAPLGDVVALDHDSADGLCGDFSRLSELAETVRRVAPQVIVNAAAYTAVDKAEGDADLAQTINALAPGVLADEAQKLGAWLVHYSTDYVFDGSGDRPWREGDATAPLSVYGRTKRDGEDAISRCTRHLIFRTSWVYSAHGANFVKTMLRLASERERLTVIDDQVGAPTGAELLADVTAHALHAVQARDECDEFAGLYHLTASGKTSWHGYAQFVIEYARRRGRLIRVAPDAVEPIATHDYPTAARRPLNSMLATGKLQAAFGLVLPDWKPGVQRVLDELLAD